MRRTLLPALLLLACKDPSPGADKGVDAVFGGAELTLAPFSLRFGSGALPAGGLQVGRVADYDPDLNHDPYNLLVPELQAEAPAITWAAATEAAWQGAALRLSFDDGTTGLLEDRGDGEGVALRLTLDEGPAPYLSLSFAAPADEGLYGMGEQFGAVEQRGNIRPMQIEADFELESSYNEAHVPVPFLVSSGGWGVGVESDWPMAWDLGVGDPERVTVIVATEAPLSFRLMSGDDERADPAAIIAQWSRATGLPRTPPTWAGAPFLWRNVNVDDAEILADAAALRENDLAFGVMWIDNPWQTTYNSMQPDPAQFADWAGMVEALHANGLRWMAWSTPYLSSEDPEHADYAADGLFADLAFQFADFGDLIDLTHPEGMARWQGRVEAAAAIGLEGWKLDYGEDIVLGRGAGRLRADFADGSDERTMHHRFAAFYHEAYAGPYDAVGADRFLLGRAGAWGTAALTDCIWPGDLDSDLRRHREDGHVGGLPAAIRAGTSLAVSGFPCFASDTGGYRHSRPNEETMIRWTEYSALLPVMQVGGGTEHHYWLNSGDWTDAVLAAGQRYTQLHTRLFPYFRALQLRASATGWPFILPPELKGGPRSDRDFFVGDALFVAPVEETGVTTAAIELPPGTWVHWWSGEAYSGAVEVPAPLGEGPLFIGEGGIVPLLDEDIRTLSPSGAGVRSWADDPGGLLVRFVPGDGALAVPDGPDILGAPNEITIGEAGIYSAIAVEIWAPESSQIYVDGVAVDTSAEGPWKKARTGPGSVTWR
jgi:alpha-D-xyloside xylohydrolase